MRGAVEFVLDIDEAQATSLQSLDLLKKEKVIRGVAALAALGS
jgi:hypothetical protein